MTVKKSGVLSLAGLSFLFVLAALSCATAEAKESAVVSREAGSGGAAFSVVEGREWMLEELVHGGESVRINRTNDMGFGDIYTLTFTEERISGMAAPNRYFGPYTAGESNALLIGPVAGTLMASIIEPEELKEYEYYAYLGRVKRWELRGGKLELHTSGEDGKDAVLVFIAR